MTQNLPAQVCSVMDTDGQIHPRWVRFRNYDGRVISAKILRVVKESSDRNNFYKSFLCTTEQYGQEQKFCLTYKFQEHNWIVRLCSNEEEYNYILNN